MKFEQDNDNEIKGLLKENQRLLIENNELLKKMRRNGIISFVFRVIWFMFVIGIPIYIYFAYIQPNWEILKAKIDNLEQVTTELEGATDGAKDWFNSFNIKPNSD